MNIKDNLSNNHLLFGQDVEFIVNNAIVYMHLPKLKHCFFDYSFQHFLFFLTAPLEELTLHSNKIQNIKSKLDLIIVSFLYKNCGLEFYYEFLLHSLQILFDDVSFDNGTIIIQNQPLTSEWFDRIADIVMAATDNKKLHQIINKDTKIQEAEERIKKIKNQNKTNNDNSLESIYMILSYEFGYSSEQILNMTLYAISRITSYTSASINYKISLIGAGNGLSKKVHFITKEKIK